MPETNIDFIYLSEPDMIKAGVTNMSQCIDSMEDMFKLLHVGDFRLAGINSDSHGAALGFPPSSPFPTMPKPTPDRRLMAMPAYLGGRFNTCGVKWYGSNIANKEKGLPRSILMYTLTDIDTGAPLAFMSANLLSAYRTGAIPGLGARYLARKDATTMGIVGPGVMARTTVTSFLDSCPDVHTIKIKGRSEKGTREFIQWLANTHPHIPNVVVVESIEQAVRDSDLVSFCTSTQTGNPDFYPMVEKDWVKPGAFLAMPASCRFDDALEQSNIRKVLDHTNMYKNWLAELPTPAYNEVPLIGMRFMEMADQGLIDPAQLEDLGKIISGDAPARQNDEEVIVLSIGGIPLEDVAWATDVYRNALDQGIGVKLNLWEQPALK